MKEHRVLLLGLGFWGTKWMGSLSKESSCRIAGVSAGRQSIERTSRAFGFPAEKGFTDYREAIEKTEADIVVITLPTKDHVDAAKRALEKGMHVLCEKPVATDMAEVRDALSMRKKHPQQKYMICQNYRWRIHNQTARKAISDGLIGRIGSIHIEFRQTEDLIGYREFLEMPLLQDVSIHHFDLVRFFTGSNCREVYAYSYHPAWSRFQGKSATEAVMVMENDVVVNYNGSWAVRGKVSSWDGDITITGDAGCLVVDHQDNVFHHDEKNPNGAKLDKVPMDKTELDYALDTFIRCVENDTEPETAVEDNQHSFAMVCAAEKSVAKGKPVPVSSIFH